MIGVYDYTVILTYLSLVSGCVGTIVAMSGVGHPYIGMFLLLLCGLCDGFDGRVARTARIWKRSSAYRSTPLPI